MDKNNRSDLQTDANSGTEKIFERVGNKVNQWQQYYNHNQEQYRRDKEFLFIDQWDDRDKQEFQRLQKPLMQFNVSYDYYKKVVGQQRYSTPQIMLRREDDNFDSSAANQEQIQKEIDLRTDVIRDIAYNSRSDIAYQTAFGNAVAGGFGAIRIITEYKNAYSFDQHILIEAVDDPERCFFDPNAKAPTKHDGDFAGYYSTMTRAEFKAIYPDIPQPKSYPMNSNVRNFTWGNRETITLVEYYEKQYYEFMLYLLSDGQKVTRKQYNKLVKKQEEELLLAEQQQLDPASISPLPEIMGKRKSRDYKMMYYKLSANHILEQQEFVGKDFPIVFVPGDLVNVSGREYTLSFTRYIKDAQRFLNYTKCEIAQAIKNGRREQYIGTPDNVAGQDLARMWKNPAVQQGILLAKPDPVTGQMPIRQPASEISSTLIAMGKIAQDDIASILGLFEANRGENGRERSGIAIKERQRTGNLGLIVFFDNLDRAIEQVGRVVLGMMPRIYDTERSMTLKKEDGTSYQEAVNQRRPDGSVQNDLTKGRYTLHVEAGPSFAAQRDDALNVLIELAKINPEIFPAIADLIAENVDIENRTQLVERLKNFVPPAILAKEQGEQLPPPGPNPQEQMAKAQMQMQAKELQLKEEELRIKQQQQMLEAEKIQIDADDQKRKDYVAGVKANAETHKANMSFRASMADSIAKIETTRQKMAKSTFEG